VAGKEKQNMKILYGVQSTGNGHINRSRELLRELRGRGHDVDVVFSGRNPAKLWAVDDFKPYKAFHGLSFVVRDGKIRHIETALKQNVFRFVREILSLDMKPYEFVITDFEPVSAWAAILAGKTRLGVGHQYAFFHKVPEKDKSLIDRIVMAAFAPAQIKIGLHWDSFGNPILPPLIKKLDRASSVKPDKMLVYLAFERLDDIVSTLKPFLDQEFYIYHHVDKPSDDGNIHLRPFSREGFLKDLDDCGGVICNAGFELPSEAIHLGKRILVCPIIGQFEQQSNALAIEQLGLGMMMPALDKSIVEKWLRSETKRSIHFPQVAPALAEWIGKKDWNSLGELSNSLWSQCRAGSQ